jgi:hypothetical protein
LMISSALIVAVRFVNYICIQKKFLTPFLICTNLWE